MDYDSLTSPRRKHAAWRLLTAGSAPFAISFLHRTFLARNIRVLSEDELASKLAEGETVEVDVTFRLQ